MMLEPLVLEQLVKRDPIKEEELRPMEEGSLFMEVALAVELHLKEHFTKQHQSQSD
jgi:hypothetical protein